jgi:hypothetical protein
MQMDGLSTQSSQSTFAIHFALCETLTTRNLPSSLYSRQSFIVSLKSLWDSIIHEILDRVLQLRILPVRPIELFKLFFAAKASLCNNCHSMNINIISIWDHKKSVRMMPSCNRRTGSVVGWAEEGIYLA